MGPLDAKGCISGRYLLGGRLSYVIGVINASSLSKKEKQTLITLVKKKNFIKRLIYDLESLTVVHRQWTTDSCVRESKKQINGHFTVLKYNLLQQDYNLIVKCLKSLYRS